MLTPQHGCLDCDEQWYHIGAGRPDARCPSCDSALVTPIGTVTVDTVEPIEVGDTVEGGFWRVITEDATDRTFAFLYGVEPGTPPTAELVWLVATSPRDQVTIDVTKHVDALPGEQLPLDRIERDLRAAVDGAHSPTATGGGVA